jgi:hypothetical protein
MVDRTRSVLAEMLTENTGTHMLDSGGASGRSWQQNQGRNFEAEPSGTISGRWGVEATHNVYHYLAERIEYDADLDAELQAFGERPERANDSYLSDAVEWVAERFPDATGIYGDGEPLTVNTYNEESALSQVLQYVYLETEEHGPIYVLSIHGGADVRGGYTRPRVFTELNGGELALFDHGRIAVSCPVCDVSVESESGGYGWSIIDGAYGSRTAHTIAGDGVYVIGDGERVLCVNCLGETGAIVAVEYAY